MVAPSYYAHRLRQLDTAPLRLAIRSYLVASLLAVLLEHTPMPCSSAAAANVRSTFLGRRGLWPSERQTHGPLGQRSERRRCVAARQRASSSTSSLCSSTNSVSRSQTVTA